MATVPNFDSRKPTVQTHEGRTPEQRAALAQLRTRLPQARVEFDPIVGAPRSIFAGAAFLSNPDAAGKAGVGIGLPASSPDDLHRATRAFLLEYPGLFGHGPEALDKAQIERESVTAHNGLRTVVWRQQLEGVPVFEAVLLAHTTKDGALVSLSSQFVPDPELASGRSASNRAALVAAPPVRAAKAIAAAVRNVGEEVRDEQVVSSPGKPDGRQRFTGPGIKGEAEASLTWLPLSHDRLSLCWEIIFTSRSRDEMFRVLIQAETGEPLLRHCLTAYLSEATFKVFTNDSPTPFSPGFTSPTNTQPAVVSRRLVTLSALDTNASPAGWIGDAGNETLGNNVDAHTDWNGINLPDLPRPQGSPARVFDFPLDLAGDPTNHASASVVQLFYWCNWMHDRLYELGFDEGAGNFQSNNFGRGGLGSDAVQADAQDGGGLNNANFSTPPDGSPGRMQMYLFSSPSPRRDGDLDAEVVLHEYTHGLSNRRVGGGVGITALQSAGLGEGWSDFYALALLSESTDDVNGNYAMGAYVSYLLGPTAMQNYYFGIRRYPYTTDLSRNPLTLKDIDPAQATSCSSGAPYNIGQFGSCSPAGAAEVHNQGEVWCVTLWQVRANLIARLGWAGGNELALRLVMDGMTLSPPNPNFLQARDALLAAELVDTGTVYRSELWAAFAKRGMGFGAISPNSSTTTGVYESFDLPDDLSASPSLGFTVSGPVGGPFSPNPVSFSLTNAGSNSLSWALASTADWLTVTPTSGSLSPGGPAAGVLATVVPLATNLPAAVYAATVLVTNLGSGVWQSRPVILRVGQPDSLTELFEANDNNLAYKSFTFTPDGSVSFYAVCRDTVSAFPSDPSGGTDVPLTDDSYAQITLSDTNTVALYGLRTNVFFIGSNGYLTFNSGDINYLESVGAHFSRPRISALFHDLNPSGGGISWKQFIDRVAVTYQNVPQYGSAAPNSFQIELFADGRIRLTYLALQCPNLLVGLSAGQGIPDGFVEENFSARPACLPRLPVILAQPASQAVQPGQNLGFNVIVDSPSTLAYHWLKNGTNLAEGGRLTGVTTANLTIAQAVEADSGLYSVAISNDYGAVLSSSATLLVSPIDHFTWAHIPSPQSVNVPFRVSVQARDSFNGMITNFNGSVALQSAFGTVLVSPLSCGSFNHGVWTGSVTVAQAATNLVLEADDGLGQTGLAEPIQVQSAPRLQMETYGRILLLIWPAGAPSLILETSPRLSPATWVPTPAPLQIGDQLLVPVPMSDPSRFYRLRSDGS